MKILACSLAACALTCAALAGEPAPWADGKYLTGNWGGLRDDLEAHGIDLFAYYTADPAGNPVGGRNQSLNYADDWFFGANIFLDKLVGWKGGRFVINGINRDGSSIRESVGGQFDPQQTVGGQNIFLYDVNFEQLLFDDKFSIKVGRMSQSDDFNSSPIYNLYMNNAIDGDIRNVLFDTQFSAYPFPVWAARVTFDPTRDWHFKLGVYQNTEEVFDPFRHGLDWSIHSGDGAFLIGQVGWTPTLFRHAASAPDGKAAAVAPREDEGLPGHYIFGGSFSTWDGYSQFGKTDKTNNSYGFYAHADQMVYREKAGANEGLTLWAASGYYPQQNIAIMPFQINVGAVYEGLLPRRPKDKLIVGFVYGRFSRDYARTVQAAGGGRPNYEIVIEGDYRIQLAKFLYLQPDVQGIIRPGGTGRTSSALVLGAQTSFIF